MKRMLYTAAALGGAWLVAAALSGGAQARLAGTITDSAGHPVEGATVIVTTPSLTNFKLTLKTDKNGKYGTILNDATLPYHVHIEKEGFSPVDVDKKIPIGETYALDAKLMSAAEAGASKGAAPAPAGGGGPSLTEQAILAYNGGVDALNAGDKAAAEAQFAEAAKKNPDLPNAWAALTQLSFEKKDWAKTLEYGRKATDLDPSLSNLYPMLAEAAKQSGDAKAAEEWSAKNAEAHPEANAKSLYNTGVAAYNKGKMKEAEASLTKAVEANPNFAEAHYLLGMAAFNQNKKDLAKTHLSKYLELDPNGKEAATVKEILPLLK